VQVRDGERLAVTTEEPGPVDATARLSMDTYQRLAAGEVTADHTMRDQLTQVEGQIYPVTLLGRWIDRSQGRDDGELERERAQRRIQEATHPRSTATHTARSRDG